MRARFIVLLIFSKIIHVFSILIGNSYPCLCTEGNRSVPITKKGHSKIKEAAIEDKVVLLQMTVMVASTKLNKIEMFTCRDFSYSRNSHSE